MSYIYHLQSGSAVSHNVWCQGRPRLSHSLDTVRESQVNQPMGKTQSTPKYLAQLTQNYTTRLHLPLDRQVYWLVVDITQTVTRHPTGQLLRKLAELIRWLNGSLRVIERRRSKMAQYRSKLKPQWSFANIRLDKLQKEEFLAWANAINEDVVEVVTAILLTGYKLSFKYDNENETWMASLTGGEDSKHNSFTTLTGRHSEPNTALLLVAYKHLVICENGSWQQQSEEDDWG